MSAGAGGGAAARRERQPQLGRGDARRSSSTRRALGLVARLLDAHLVAAERAARRARAASARGRWPSTSTRAPAGSLATRSVPDAAAATAGGAGAGGCGRRRGRERRLGAPARPTAPRRSAHAPSASVGDERERSPAEDERQREAGTRATGRGRRGGARRRRLRRAQRGLGRTGLRAPRAAASAPTAGRRLGTPRSGVGGASRTSVVAPTPAAGRRLASGSGSSRRRRARGRARPPRRATTGIGGARRARDLDGGDVAHRRAGSRVSSLPRPLNQEPRQYSRSCTKALAVW